MPIFVLHDKLGRVVRVGDEVRWNGSYHIVKKLNNSRRTVIFSDGEEVLVSEIEKILRWHPGKF